jgi:hypothetical protein
VEVVDARAGQVGAEVDKGAARPDIGPVASATKINLMLSFFLMS